MVAWTDQCFNNEFHHNTLHEMKFFQAHCRGRVLLFHNRTEAGDIFDIPTSKVLETVQPYDIYCLGASAELTSNQYASSQGQNRYIAGPI